MAVVTGEQVIGWIDQNLDAPLLGWQREVITGVFDSGYRRVVVSTPRLNGHTSMNRSVEQALSALRA
jgi:hypothetical protein